MQIVLASSSRYRRSLLERLEIDFLSDAPNIDESSEPGESAEALVRRLAESKARAIAERHPDSLIIGSDQVAALGNDIVSKPRDHEDAVSQLRAASGQCSTLYCGIAVLNTGKGSMQSTVERVEVECRELSDGEIERYLAADRPYDCCGSLKVEGLGISLLKRITSDDPNAITGLPVIRLLEMLRTEGVGLP